MRDARPPTPVDADGPADADLLAEALAGLTRTPKRLPGTLLWDEAGSILFERISRHPDYYPAAHERRLLPEVARAMAGRLGPGATIVEFGSGANHKIRTLLDALPEPARVVSIDISRAFLEASAARLAADYPGVEVVPVAADYGRPIRLPVDLTGGPVLGFFPGTTIGNASPAEAAAFLGRARDALGPSLFLVGADPTRDESRLRRAYGACDGLMPAFHLNLLTRLNRAFGTGFDPADFRHEVRLLDAPFRVEAHLVALRAQRQRLGDGEVAFEAGESVRTDTSHKYPPEAFAALAQRGGWRVERTWLDAEAAFSIHLLSA